MEQLHPVLDAMMLEHGYGRVLSRPGLSLRLRELCVIAALAGQDVAPQLVRDRPSHAEHPISQQLLKQFFMHAEVEPLVY
jgi:hypothetical protein